jgi:hypothetical protein
MSVFSDDEFVITELTNRDGELIKCWLRDNSSSTLLDLLRNDSTGTLKGYMVEPDVKPNWMIPGTILKGVVLGVECYLTLQPSFKSSIGEIDLELGEKVIFSFSSTSEFSDNE